MKGYKVTKEEKDAIAADLLNGSTYGEVIKKHDRSIYTIRRIVKEYGLNLTEEQIVNDTRIPMETLQEWDRVTEMLRECAGKKRGEK